MKVTKMNQWHPNKVICLAHPISRLFNLILFCRVHARIAHPIKGDPFRPEYHRAVLKWARDDGTGRPG